MAFQIGDTVIIRPEWRGEGEGETRYVIVQPENVAGRVQIKPVSSPLAFPPIETVAAEYLQRVA